MLARHEEQRAQFLLSWNPKSCPTLLGFAKEGQGKLPLSNPIEGLLPLYSCVFN